MACVPPYHVLDFFYDDEDGCALTITRNSVRFHIIADAKRLKDESKAEDGREYFRLLQDLRDHERLEDEQTSVDSGIDLKSSHTTGSESKRNGSICEDAEEKMHKWILAPLSTHLNDLAPKPAPSEEHTLEQWVSLTCRLLQFPARHSLGYSGTHGDWSR